MNDPLAQLEASKPVIKDLFRDLLIEIVIIMNVLRSKLKQNCDREFTTVCVNSTAKTVINRNRYGLGKSFV